MNNDSQTNSTCSDTSTSADASSVDKTKQTSKIEKWLAKRSKNELLFLLSSTAGQLATIYDQFGSITRAIRVSMDGKYLIMGEQTILLDKDTLDISLGIQTKSTGTEGKHNFETRKQSSSISSMTNEELDDYVYKSLCVTYEHHDFEEISERYARRQLIASKIENAANTNEHLPPKHCITLHVANDSETTITDIVVEFVNVTQRYLWAKGLSRLISCKKRNRKYRCKAVSYILDKYSNILTHHALMATKRTSDDILAEEMQYFQNRKEYGSLLDKHIFIKSFQKMNNNLYNDQITMDLMPSNINHIRDCFVQIKSFWNSLFDAECKYVRKLPKKYALLYRRRTKRCQKTLDC